MASLFSSERPTLPPLHTLDLPVPLAQKSNDSYEHQSRTRLHVPQQWHSRRQASFSSSTSSRTPSPTPSDYLATNYFANVHSSSVHSTSSPKFRLVPSTLDAADAVIVVPPPSTPYIPNISTSISAISPLESTKQGQALLLVGPALQHFRHPQRQVAKGARIHPYRIVQGDRSRRASDSSTLSV